jgi:hypothetical protein
MPTTKVSSVWGVNELGEIVAVQGTGTTNITGYLYEDGVPVDSQGRLVIAGLSGGGAGPTIQSVTFNSTIPLTFAGTSYMASKVVNGPLTFTPAAGAVQGALVYLRLTADGVNTPNFSAFKEWGGSLGYDNRNGIVNQMQFFYDGADLFYTASQAVGATATPASASAITMAGPTSGVVSVASSNFTVGVSPVGGTIMGTVVITPSDSGAGGTFSPSSASLTSAQPTATFSYTPTSTGAKTISVANNGSLSNPVAITYNVTAAATPLRFSSLVRVAEVGTDPYTYTGSGAGANYGSTEADSVLNKAFQSGVDGEFVYKILNAPSSSNEVLVGVDPAATTGVLYSTMDYAVNNHLAGYRPFTSGTGGTQVTSCPGAANDFVKVARVGTSLTIRVSKDGGTTFPTTIGTWTVPTGVLYIHMMCTGVGSWTPISSSGLA